MNTTWPEGVIARYLTTGGATVNVTERPGYVIYEGPTESAAICEGCGDAHVSEWGFDVAAHDNGRPQRDDFEQRGRRSTREARAWAQGHAEKCRAMPKPEATR